MVKVKAGEKKKESEGVSFLVSCRGRHSPANGLPSDVSLSSPVRVKCRFRSTADSPRLAYSIATSALGKQNRNINNLGEMVCQ